MESAQVSAGRRGRSAEAPPCERQGETTRTQCRNLEQLRRPRRHGPGEGNGPGDPWVPGGVGDRMGAGDRTAKTHPTPRARRIPWRLGSHNRESLLPFWHGGRPLRGPLTSRRGLDVGGVATMASARRSLTYALSHRLGDDKPRGKRAIGVNPRRR